MTIRRILFVGDIHAPYEDPEAWSAMLDFGRKYKPHQVIQLGDAVDCYSVSSYHPKNERKLLLADEARAGRKLLADLKKLRAESYHMLLGNHEHRVEAYMDRHAGAFAGCVNIQGLLGLKDSGWTWTPYGSHYRLGKLFCSHDAGGVGAQAHMTGANLFGGNYIQGHTHRLAVGYKTSATGKSVVGCMSGWLGKAKMADYASDIAKSAWMHGFVIGSLEPNGNIHLQPVPIYGGKAHP